MEAPKILSLDSAGIPFRWITRRKAAEYYNDGKVSWSIGLDDFPIYGGTNRISGEQSSFQLNSIIAIKGKVLGPRAHKNKHEPRLTNVGLFQRDRFMCGYCGQTHTKLKLSRDHIMPVSKGGPDTWNNVITSCKGCNHRKNDRTPEQAGMPLLMIPFVPNRSESLILSNHNVLADQMEYLLKSVSSNYKMM